MSALTLTNLNSSSTLTAFAAVAATTYLLWYASFYHQPSRRISKKSSSSSSKSKSKAVSKLRTPPRVPYFIPMLGHTLSIISNPTKFIQQCHDKYGDVFTCTVLGEDITYFRGQPYLQKITSASEQTAALIPAYRRIIAWLVGNDFFQPLSKAFYTNLSQARIDDLTHAMANMAMETWPKLIHATTTGRTEVEMRHVLNRMVLTLATQANVGDQVTRDHIDAIFKRMELIESDYSTWTMLTTYENSDKRVRKIARMELCDLFKQEALRRVEKIKRGEKVSNDLLTNLLLADYFGKNMGSGKEYADSEDERAAQSDANEESPALKRSPDQILQVLSSVTFGSIFGAHTNTYLTTVLLLRELSKHPEYIRRIRDEAYAVFGTNPLQALLDPSTPSSTLHECKELLRCITETTRVYASGGILRMIVKEEGVALDDQYYLPKGSLVSAYTPLLNHSEEMYGKDNAATWNPDRYLDEHRPSQMRFDANIQAPVSTARVTHISSFGCGRLVCPGRFLAYRIIQLVILTLLLQWDVEELIEDLGMTNPIVFPGMGMISGHLRLALCKRSN